MSDKQGNGAGEQQQQVPPVIINGQYIKDLSFEAPNSPDILTELQGAQPDINIDVNVTPKKLENPDHPNLFEVTLEFAANLSHNGKTGFVAELQYAGVFTLNIPEEHHQAFLMIECPRMLFPFARQLLSDMTQQGGFMPLYLQPIDFAAMFQQNMQQHAAELDKEVADIDQQVADTIKEKGED